MAPPLSTLVDRVAKRTIERDTLQASSPAEDWELAIAIDGLFATGDPEHVAAAQALVDRIVEVQGSEGKLGFDDPKPWFDAGDRSQTASPALITGCLACHDRSGDEAYLDAAERQVDFLLNEATRLEEGSIAVTTAGDELWVDSLYLTAVPLVQYGIHTDTPAAVEEGIEHTLAQIEHLQDPRTQLFRHKWRERPNTYPDSTFWSRGNGWAAAGLLRIVEAIPSDHDHHQRLLERFRGVCRAVRPLQDESGFWHHIIDDPWTAKETSGTLQFAYVFDRAVELGLLEDGAYRRAARRAFEGCQGVVTDEGAVTRVAVPPGGPDVPLGVASYGQGWFLLAAAQLGAGSD